MLVEFTSYLQKILRTTTILPKQQQLEKQTFFQHNEFNIMYLHSDGNLGGRYVNQKCQQRNREKIMCKLFDLPFLQKFPHKTAKFHKIRPLICLVCLPFPFGRETCRYTGRWR